MNPSQSSSMAVMGCMSGSCLNTIHLKRRLKLCLNCCFRTTLPLNLYRFPYYNNSTAAPSNKSGRKYCCNFLHNLMRLHTSFLQWFHMYLMCCSSTAVLWNKPDNCLNSSFRTIALHYLRKYLYRCNSTAGPSRMSDRYCCTIRLRQLQHKQPPLLIRTSFLQCLYKLFYHNNSMAVLWNT